MTCRDIDDIIRMCRRRIRVPDQWYGDYLAMLGAARIGERRLKELCRKYGAKTIKAFIADWFDYSERRAIESIRKLPKARECADWSRQPSSFGGKTGADHEHFRGEPSLS